MQSKLLNSELLKQEILDEPNFNQKKLNDPEEVLQIASAGNGRRLHDRSEAPARDFLDFQSKLNKSLRCL